MATERISRIYPITFELLTPADLHRCFTETVSQYCHDETLVRQLYMEINDRYSEKHRHYHNLHHLLQLYQELLSVKEQLQDWHTTLLSMFYHDVIYNVMKQNNEEQSAALAHERLSLLGYPLQRTERCILQILATKGHLKSYHEDTNFFTDSDLSILGASPAAYQNYAVLIRKEYALYPDALYKPGRKRVLQRFLAMDRIFKTDIFYSRYEHQARSNMLNELSDL